MKSSVDPVTDARVFLEGLPLFAGLSDVSLSHLGTRL